MLQGEQSVGAPYSDLSAPEPRFERGRACGEML
jgi:hypothetical protein